jgi:hypothetical protein
MEVLALAVPVVFSKPVPALGRDQDDNLLTRQNIVRSLHLSLVRPEWLAEGTDKLSLL